MLGREKRALTLEDLQVMAVPRRFWNVRFGGITAMVDGRQGPLADKVSSYAQRWEQNLRDGVGMLLSGPNGVGKTAAAVVVAIAYKRWGATVLFVSACDMLKMRIEDQWFSEDVTWWQWAREVDVLLLDDLGKGSDGSGFAMTMWDELLRYRHDQRYVTIITTNLALSNAETIDGEWLGKVLKPSTLAVLKEAVVPLRVHGRDRRDEAVAAIAAQYV